MTAALTPVPKIQFFADDGTPLVGGKLYSYAAGTTTPLATYTTYSGTVANTNPVILDSRGEANVWLGANVYKLALYDSVNALIWTVDNITPVGDASLVSYLPAGTGAVVTTVQAKLRESVSVADFGAVGDGVADDTAAIQAALDHVQTLKGGVVNIPTGTFKITSMLSVSVGAVVIRGAGADLFHGTGTQGVLAATKLLWAGANGGTMLKFFSAEGLTAPKQSGGGIENIYFDSGVTTNGTGASYAIQFLSRDFALLANLHFHEFQVSGLRMGCVTELFDPRDPQSNKIERCSGRNYVNLTGGSFLLDGDAAVPASGGAGGTYVGANVSLNTFSECGCVFTNGEAFSFKNSDHNFLFNCRAFRLPGSTGFGLAFHGSNAGAAGGYTARKNVIHGFSGGTVLRAYSTATYTYASGPNQFTMLDDANNTPYPTIESGTEARVPIIEVITRNNLVHYFPGMFSPVAVYAGTFANADSLAGYAQSRVTTEALRVENGASDGIRIARPDVGNATVTSEFSIAPVGTSLNLKFSRLTGTGVVQMSAGMGYTVNTVGSVTLTNQNNVVLIDATSVSRTITLPLANSYGAGVSGEITIRRIDASANTVTIQRQSTDTLNGTTSETLGANVGKTYVCDAVSAWFSF